MVLATFSAGGRGSSCQVYKRGDCAKTQGRQSCEEVEAITASASFPECNILVSGIIAVNKSVNSLAEKLTKYLEQLIITTGGADDAEYHQCNQRYHFNFTF